MSGGKLSLDTRSLMERVYEYLRQRIHRGELAAGKPIDLNAISRRLGISKTPLRDALIRMETEGFVTIRPRRGVYVNPVTLEDVRQYYEIIGALESMALVSAFPRIKTRHFKTMQDLILGMDHAINDSAFDLFYRRNLAFHNTYLSLCRNPRLIHIVDTQKRRLYDFPPQPHWIPEWERASMIEHRHILELLEAGKIAECSNYIRGVHWSFRVQEAFIRRYYPPHETARENRK
ncbi:MAG TPA: GntR family transcriptional regulator [Candidatus Aminicenantes bacterium]|nr:GntR family transcriptional regulator [Candidatus Aminicenantes bacterium]